MHEENFSIIWQRENLVGKEERRKEDKKIREEVKRKGRREEEEKREGEKEENETVTVKEGVHGSRKTFHILSQGAYLESCGVSRGDLVEDPGELLDCDPGARMEGPVGACCD